ncbi:hypothetical protein GUJ93_ZPchr0007g3330 [Zizania palustris]|uniref:Uncharacterized protein n=1 Tax=Zizania palustris TaxID=103762 RepID=A0A8J5ST15_ZIZPA|nr:hypothetical protein GUJ93_ZPchr0007g3330 [Zizania palustris]
MVSIREVVGQQICHVKGAAAAAASTVAETAKPGLARGLVFVKGVAADVASKTEGVGVGKAAALVGGAAVAAYFLWPVAAVAAGATGSATMSAPGAAGFVISRAAFLANPKLYFYLLRTAGYKAAVAAFAV